MTTKLTNKVAIAKKRKLTVKKRKFLAAFEETASVARAAAAAGISRIAHYNWLRDDPEYAEKFNEVKEDAIEMLEEVARQRAILGTRRFKFDKNGKPILHPETGEPYIELEYSDTLLIFLLKAAKPEVYRDNVKPTGGDSGGDQSAAIGKLLAALFQSQSANTQVVDSSYIEQAIREAAKSQAALPQPSGEDGPSSDSESEGAGNSEAGNDESATGEAG